MVDKNPESVNRKEVLAGTEGTAYGNDRRETRRRGFLSRAIGVLSVLLPSYVTTNARAADDSFERETAIAAAAKYDSVGEITNAVNEHATLLLRGLKKDGILRSAALSDLPLSHRYTSLQQYSNAKRGVYVFGSVQNGEPRTNIQVKTELPDGKELLIVVVPQTGHSYAVLRDSDSSGRISITAEETSDGGVTTRSCSCMEYDYKCRIHCVSVGSCSCAEFTIGSYCSDDTGADCTYCAVDYSDCSSCSDTYSCP